MTNDPLSFPLPPARATLRARLRPVALGGVSMAALALGGAFADLRA
ncbi:hypothetical protein [Camelimonas abortus]